MAGRVTDCGGNWSSGVAKLTCTCSASPRGRWRRNRAAKVSSRSLITVYPFSVPVPACRALAAIEVASTGRAHSPWPRSGNVNSLTPGEHRVRPKRPIPWPALAPRFEHEYAEFVNTYFYVSYPRSLEPSAVKVPPAWITGEVPSFRRYCIRFPTILGKLRSTPNVRRLRPPTTELQ